MRLLTKKITYPAGDITVPGFLCLPEDQAACATVIILHGSDGHKSNHEEIARLIAREGFAALSLTWFGGASARSHWSELRAEDILQSVAFLKQQPTIDGDKLGLIGFSRGGGLALIMASLLPQTRAVVNYFGLTAWRGGLQEFDHLPLNQSEPLDFIRNLSCPVLSFHGKQDSVVSVENTLVLDRACKKYGVDHRYILYPDVNHSFVWPGDKYNRKAHQDSWELTLAFYKNHLK
ncbi:MAG: dienelactone hydrolase family protein [Deltaproteobacteria bacterium]|nr:dienelactone hydrolase family protein [Deltaproteobacteria bacterium]